MEILPSDESRQVCTVYPGESRLLLWIRQAFYELAGVYVKCYRNSIKNLHSDIDRIAITITPNLSQPLLIQKSHLAQTSLANPLFQSYLLNLVSYQNIVSYSHSGQYRLATVIWAETNCLGGHL